MGLRKSSSSTWPGWTGEIRRSLVGVPSVIVGDLDVVGVTVAPDEADPPLIIDPDAVLPTAVSAQRFQTISRRHAQRLESGRRVELNQLPIGDALYLARQPPREPPLEHALGFPITEALDHATHGNARHDYQASASRIAEAGPELEVLG